MDINDLIISDDALAVIEQGAWVGDFSEAPGVEVKVLGLTSKGARKALESKQALLRMKGRGEALTSDQLATCMREVLGEVVLNDWRGLKNGGADVPFDRATAVQWMTSRNGERFADIVLRAAQRVDNRSGDFVEKATKN